MCLAIPGLIVELLPDEEMAVIDYKGLKAKACTRLLPEAAVGDYALVHAGFIIQTLPPEEGEELAALAEEAGLL